MDYNGHKNNSMVKENFKMSRNLKTKNQNVYNMLCFASRASSRLQHVLFCQPCNFLIATCFVLSNV
jgi:hypothetical protein